MPQLKGREKLAAFRARGLNSKMTHQKIRQTAERSEPHLSVSGSRKTSSLSSPVLAAPGTTGPGVDVLTMGTDWEACSVVSD